MNAKTIYGKCLRKRRYGTLEVAEKECKRISKVSGIQFYVYWCKFCQGYHLTKQPRDKTLDKINIQ